MISIFSRDTCVVSLRNALATLRRSLTTLLAVSLLAGSVPGADDSPVSRAVSTDESAFERIFDGKSLKGWESVPADAAADWSVRDGVIAGKGSANRLAYLVWKERDLQDFELKFDYRMVTDGNSGVELRAQPDSTGKRPFEGYHADFGHIGIGSNVLGAWDFHFASRKEPPCPRGHSLVIAEDQSVELNPLKVGLELEHLHRRDWNSVHVKAEGQHMQFFINGQLASEFTDHASDGQLKKGAIGLQLHDKGMVVEFRNVRLKKLAARKPAPVTSARRPNIVLIMSDDMGYSDIGCFGGEIQTPTLDGLAKDGLRFSQFYNTARCCPTRASLLTGLYQHQAGIGHMMSDSGKDGYRGDLNQNCRTIAEVLGSSGYSTYMSGKWHVTKHATNIFDEELKSNWPRQRGFDRFYGTITGAGSFYDPATLARDNEYVTPENDSDYQPETYYYTNAITDNAIEFLSEHDKAADDRPFFLYVAYTAAHWPMHALPQDIRKYRGKYDGGYTPIREARYSKMKQLGLIQEGWGMNAQVGDWASVQHPEWEARCMEVYAAMIDNMDQGIGRLMETLESQGERDNTIVFFLQDNGGCAENMGRSPQTAANWAKSVPKDLKPLGRDGLQTRIAPPMQTRDGRWVQGGPQIMPGGEETYVGYGKSWANVSNTPFREYKHWVHEGGISTPLIVHWPEGIPTARHGQIEHQPGHLIDIMATCVDVADAQYPQEADSQPIHPMQGVSLASTFAGGDLKRNRPIFFEHEGNRAVREARWKLVAKGARGPWELYDMQADRSELHNLADQHPEEVERLSKAWQAWAIDANVLPWIWDPKPARASRKKRFEIKPGTVLSGAQMPDTSRRGMTIKVDIERMGAGVLIAHGGVAHGFSLYVDQDQKLCFAIRRGGELTTVRSAQPLPSKPTQIVCDVTSDAMLQVKANGTSVLESQLPGLLTTTPADSCSAGLDSNDPVGDYPREFRFNGKLNSVTLNLLKR